MTSSSTYFNRRILRKSGTFFGSYQKHSRPLVRKRISRLCRHGLSECRETCNVAVKGLLVRCQAPLSSSRTPCSQNIDDGPRFDRSERESLAPGAGAICCTQSERP